EDGIRARNVTGVQTCALPIFERILLGVGDVAPHYQLVLERPGALDELTLLCEPVRDGLDRELLRSRLQRALHEQAGLSVTVQVRSEERRVGKQWRSRGSMDR